MVDTGAHRRPPLRLLSVLSATCLLAFGTSTATATAACVVTTASDTASSGTLREAISQADAGQCASVIDFAIGAAGSAQVIKPASALPAITAPVTLDGWTQGGSRYSGAPLVRLDGGLAGAGANGLTITGGSSTVEGLAITDWAGDGVDLNGAGANIVKGDRIGTDGIAALPNGSGVAVEGGSHGNVIGGPTVFARDVISGNTSYGVLVNGGSRNVIEGDFIGPAATGRSPLGNSTGVQLQGGFANRIGGTSGGDRDVISGNYDGVALLPGGSPQAPVATYRNVVEGNFIGLNAYGTAALANNGDGVFIEDTPIYVNGQRTLFVTGNTLGGTAGGTANVISGNVGDGIEISSAARNTVEGDLIGTDASGTRAVPNSFGIVDESASNYAFGGNTIGASAAGAGNVVSGNADSGILISSVEGGTIAGNEIGTNAAGTAALPNGSAGGSGIDLDGAREVTVGGTASGSGNVISGNDGTGVHIDNSASFNHVLGNEIGTDRSGASAIPNALDGVELDSGASSNRIGGTVAGDANTIAFNRQDGVQVDGKSFTGYSTGEDAIEANAIFSSGHLGIELSNSGNSGRTPPRVGALSTSGTVTTISGTVIGPAASQHVEVFANPTCTDPEGRTYLGNATVHATSGPSTWTLTVPALSAGEGVTATDTNSIGDTSQFSACHPA